MIIDATLRHSVAFLCQEGRSGRVQPMASAFLVGVVPPTRDYLTSYLVTARHNLECSKKDRTLFVRINTVERKFVDVPISIDDFEQHSTSDVALMQIALPPLPFCTFIPHSMMLTSEMLARRPLDEGADLCMPALFSEFHGRDVMYPIVRTGRLALMPEEKVCVQLHPQQEEYLRGYLIECFSWGGCSGAPVFVDYFDPTAVSSDKHAVNTTRLLGILCSHFSIPSAEVKAGDFEPLQIPLNGGIAFVVPAQGILDLLMADHLVEQRDKDRKIFLEAIASTKGI